jgi:hypothetical protein
VTVRDGRSVVSSLLRRGYTLYEAALCWLWETHTGDEAVRLSDRVIEVRYEDLVREPFDVVQGVAARSGVDSDPAEIARRFRDNPYRSGLDRVASWRSAAYRGTVEPGYGFDELDPGDLRLLESLVLIRPDGSSVGFSESLVAHGYEPGSDGSAPASELHGYAREYVKRTANLDAQRGHVLVSRAGSIPEQIAEHQRLVSPV